MIRFDNWTIQADGEILARQFDNLTRTLTVTGDIPAGWEWDVLVQVGDAMDIIPLEAAQGALSTVLTAKQLSFAGYYQMQIRGTQGEKVQHTNIVSVYIDDSLSGDEQWPEIPSEFTALEQRVKADAGRAEAAAKRAEDAGGGGGGPGKDGGYYSPEVTQPTADTMELTFEPSAEGMPAVSLVRVTLPAGPAGANGQDGAPGVSCTHAWNGTTLTVTSAAGTSSADLKGEKGEPGKDGADGAPGPAGPAYELTEADKQELVDAVLAALPDGDEVSY